MVINVAQEIQLRPEGAQPIYDAKDLTKGGQIAQIKLDQQMYTLRITRAGKLILTK